MNNDHPPHDRKSMRLKGYDYSRPGAYFITIVSAARQHLFGNIQNGVVSLNRFGEFVQWHWQQIPAFHPHIQLDAFVVMPDHIHGIIILNDTVSGVVEKKLIHRSLKPNGTLPGSISQVIQNFKSVTTRKIRQLSEQRDMEVWQRNYYDHIIRNQDEWKKIHLYILANPEKWPKEPSIMSKE